MIKYYKLLDRLHRAEMSKGEFAQLMGFSSTTVAKLSAHKPVSMEVVDRICKEFRCQPGDIMEYIPDDEEGDNDET